MNAMVPAPVQVHAVHRESPDTVTLTFAVSDKAGRAGQFNMLYAFGVGEVAISASGDPAREDVVVHTVKAVGAVTNALCALDPGGFAGLRGPFGTPWPLRESSGKDLILVAGGLGFAPLRPVIYHALAHRSSFGRLVLLVGARTPEDLLYRSELESWQGREDMTVLVTVDRAGLDWRGRVGVVPALLSEIAITNDAVAFVCGPEVMMRFAVRALVRAGTTPDRIYLSLERNMKCALGLCGRCQFGPSFICKDGPVLSYEQIAPWFLLKEI